MEINSTAIAKRLADTEPGELIVLRIGEHRAGNQTYRSTAGALYLEDNRWTVCFDTSDPRDDELHFDLTGRAICDGPSNVAAPVLNWSVWGSRHEFERETNPLVTVTAAQA